MMLKIKNHTDDPIMNPFDDPKVMTEWTRLVEQVALTGVLPKTTAYYRALVDFYLEGFLADVKDHEYYLAAGVDTTNEGERK